MPAAILVCVEAARVGFSSAMNHSRVAGVSRETLAARGRIAFAAGRDHDAKNFRANAFHSS
jgi:hypothetical protein